MIKDNYTRSGKVVNVVDGDTIDIEVDLGFYTSTRQRIRLLRINCPEMTGESHTEGLKAKEYTAQRLLNKEVVFMTMKTDTFKRWLAEVWYINDQDQQININEELLKNNMAVRYLPK